jgi:hypothetical protein
MTAPPLDNLESLDRAMRLSNLRHELEEKTFYGVAVAGEAALPPGETTRLAEAKRQLIEDAVVVAPLAAHIVRGARIECEAVADEYAHAGPVTCFRVHEILRKTRPHPEARILLDGTPVAREELLAMYRLLVPNTNLEPLSRLTLYTLPRILLAGVVGGIVAGAWAGRAHVPEVGMDFRAALMGGALVAAVMSLLGQFALSRNVVKTAPWNAALYNDANFALYRQAPALLYLARREYLDRNHFIKGGLNGRRYHERARAIESGAYVDLLRRHREQRLARRA